MRVFAVLSSILVLAGCTQPEWVPPDYDSLPQIGRISPQEADFHLADELSLATAACVASELKGPAVLNSLRSEGYSAAKDLGAVKYVKISPRAEPGLLTGGIRAVVVSDSGKASCKIEVPRGQGYSSMAAVGAALVKQGYQRAGGNDSAPRFAKDGVVFSVTGSLGPYAPLASISVLLMQS